MKTRAVRLYGENDLRVENFDLPQITEDELLLNIISDTICTSTYKAVKQGSNHKRVPKDIDKNPIIVGHEMCGLIIQVGEKLKNLWKVGEKVVIQPALKLESGYDPGYSYKYIGGNSIYVVVPKIVLDKGCVIRYNGEGFYSGSLVESLGCIVRGMKGFYHTDYTTYTRFDGAKKRGKLAVLGGAGPMGLGAVEVAMGYANLSQVVVTDINEERLSYAINKCSPEKAKEKGCDLRFVSTKNLSNPADELIKISDGGFDDVFVMAPIPELFNMAEKICREDGCINFFAGPVIHDVQGSLNLYRIHYDGIHVVGTTGSIPEDTFDVIKLLEENKINSGVLISHILSLDALPDAIMAMEKPNGAKKVCYNGIKIPLVAIDDFEKLGKTDDLYKNLDIICKKNGGVWCVEAEKYLLEHAPKVEL